MDLRIEESANKGNNSQKLKFIFKILCNVSHAGRGFSNFLPMTGHIIEI